MATAETQRLREALQEVRRQSGTEKAGSRVVAWVGLVVIGLLGKGAVLKGTFGVPKFLIVLLSRSSEWKRDDRGCLCRRFLIEFSCPLLDRPDG